MQSGQEINPLTNLTPTTHPHPQEGGTPPTPTRWGGTMTIAWGGLHPATYIYIYVYILYVYKVAFHTHIYVNMDSFQTSFNMFH